MCWVLVAAAGLFIVNSWLLLIVAVHKLSCFQVCGIFFSQQGDLTQVCCIRRLILNHWTISKVPPQPLNEYLGWAKWLTRWLSGKESTCRCRRHRRCRFNPWVRKIPWRKAWQSTSVFLPGEAHGQKNLVGYSPWGCKE